MRRSLPTASRCASGRAAKADRSACVRCSCQSLSGNFLLFVLCAFSLASSSSAFTITPRLTSFSNEGTKKDLPDPLGPASILNRGVADLAKAKLSFRNRHLWLQLLAKLSARPIRPNLDQLPVLSHCHGYSPLQILFNHPATGIPQHAPPTCRRKRRRFMSSHSY